MNIFHEIKKAILPSNAFAKYAISLDVGTEFVKALLFENKDGVAHVIGTGRYRQTLVDMQAGTVTDIEGVVQNCIEAISQAEEMAGKQAEQVIIGIAGELVKGASTVIEYQRAEPNQKITMKELEEIVKRVQWKAFDEVRAKLAEETGYQEVEVKLVNAAIVDVRIDGYRVHNPIGFQGKNLSVSLFNSFAPLVHLGALQSVAENLDLDLLSVATEPYAVAVGVNPDSQEDFSAIFIDIGGGTTDVALLRNGGLQGTKMFNLGGRAFTKRIASHFKIAYERAEAKKLSYSEGSLPEKEAKEVKKLMEADADVWMQGIELTLEELAKDEHLPPRILLCGGGSSLPEIEKSLQGYNWQKTLPFAFDPELSFIEPKHVQNVIDLTGTLDSVQDITPMAMANLALEYMGEEQILDGVLRRALKILGG